MRCLAVAAVVALACSRIAWAQDGPHPGGPPGGRGPMGEERKLVKQFDADGSGWLNRAERDAARAFLKENPTPRPGPRRDQSQARSQRPGETISPDGVERYPDAPLYDTGIVRTFFLEFEDKDWEQQLDDFYGSDVEVPATLIVDGQRLKDVGVSFRGASSFFMTPPGKKRSFNISLDFLDRNQRLHGVRTLNLLNGHGDPSFMSTLLFSHMARGRIPAPEANFVRVAVNGENWGIYVSAEQYNADFERKHWGSTEGARWKVKGSPNGASGLDYIGDDLKAYKRRYDMKAGSDEDWQALIELCRVLSTTPIESLEDKVRPMLDVEGVLWFLALDNALVNSDGYWVRASDYSIYRDEQGVFHIFPHDMNEAFSTQTGPPGRGRRPGAAAGGPGGPPGGGPRQGPGGPPPVGPRAQGGPGGRGPRGQGWTLDPLIGMDDPGKPLRSRLLQVPSLREQYLRNVRQIAEESMDWDRVGPLVARWRALIIDEIEAETRHTSPYEAFERMTSPEFPGGEMPRPNLRLFLERRAEFLLSHPEISKLGPE